MFGSWKSETPQVRAVQPMLAIVVHTAVIAWAVGNHPAPQVEGHQDDLLEERIFVFPHPTRDPGTTGRGGSVAGIIPGRLPPPDMPPSPVLPVLSKPGEPTRHGVIDPRSMFGAETRTDSASPGSVLSGGTQVSDPPQVLKFSEPAYPEPLRQAGIAGAVTVTYIVDPSGDVEPGSVQIVSSDHPAFSESVRDALGRAKFIPGRVHGQAVRVLVQQTFRFATRD